MVVGFGAVGQQWHWSSHHISPPSPPPYLISDVSIGANLAENVDNLWEAMPDGDQYGRLPML